jgi:two-component system response regulator AtoC
MADEACGSRILIVDDVECVRELLCDAIGGPGIRIDTAGSCRESYRLLNEHTYDWALLDHRLPDGEGLQILRTIRETSPTTRVLVISSEAAYPDFVLEALSLGAERVFPKPVPIVDLMRVFYTDAGAWADCNCKAM